ncbi:MAG: uridine kinase, partial [Erysipelothrix sp.]|nr:uridine kinase [Erysipelothrix sp.]
MKPIIIGIAGGSASGKTSIARILKEHFIDTKSVYIVKMDDYYKDQSHLSLEERYEMNYDHPFAFDMDLLIEDIKSLKNGESIDKPVYDFIQHTRSDYREHVDPTDVLVLEGLMTLENEELRD